ncbi:T9SS type A sorting domain-containing protein [Chitinophagales bacterium]|nr:T9SS type A sorting domain-containing protein [Chitinophagales bacterium]
MRKIYTLLFAAAFCFALQAQGITFDFDVANSEGHSIEGATISSQSNFVTNNTDQLLTIVWLRTINMAPQGWTPQVCDKATCWGPDTDTKTFTLEPGEKGLLKTQNLHGGNIGEAYARIVVWAEGDSTNLNAVADFYASTWALGLEDEVVETIRIYPNPVVSSLTIEVPNSSTVVSAEIYNLIGQRIDFAELSANRNEHELQLSGLDSGLYFVAFLDEKGNTVDTRKFSKQ